MLVFLWYVGSQQAVVSYWTRSVAMKKKCRYTNDNFMVPFERLEKLSTPLKVQYFTPHKWHDSTRIKMHNDFLTQCWRVVRTSKEKKFGHTWLSLFADKLKPQRKRLGTRKNQLGRKHKFFELYSTGNQAWDTEKTKGVACRCNSVLLF